MPVVVGAADDYRHVVGGARQMGADRPGDVHAAGDRQRAAFAEVVLDVNDDERAHTPTVPWGPVPPRVTR